MKKPDREATIVATEPLNYQAYQLQCSAERLSSGLFQAAVRYEAPPDGELLTLIIDPGNHVTAGEAVQRAKELAVMWVDERGGRLWGKTR